MDNSTLKSRLRAYIQEKDLTIRSFERIAGLANGTVGSKSLTLSARYIAKIVENFPDLNQSWLLTGEGEMFVEGTANSVATSGGVVSSYNKGGTHTVNTASESFMEVLKSSQELALNSQQLAKHSQDALLKQQEQIDRLLRIIEKMQDKE